MAAGFQPTGKTLKMSANKVLSITIMDGFIADLSLGAESCSVGAIPIRPLLAALIAIGRPRAVRVALG
jgi:hypothetical protein